MHSSLEKNVKLPTKKIIIVTYNVAEIGKCIPTFNSNNVSQAHLCFPAVVLQD